MTASTPLLQLLLCTVLALCLAAASSDDCRPDAIVVDPDASALAQLAGRELRRYLWHVTARLVPIYGAIGAVPQGHRRLVVAERSEQLHEWLLDAPTVARVEQLQPSEHLILLQRANPLTVVVAGGDGLGALYASYLYAHDVLGVHFSLSGDVLPKMGDHHGCRALVTGAGAAEQRETTGNDLDVVDTPRFPLRGLQPFFNFAEGPDWWSDDHWRAVLTQAAKMRMNMIAIHTYTPTRSIGTTNYSTTGVWAGQPQLWVGMPENVTADGNITPAGAYAVKWASTAEGSFSIQDGRGTSAYPWGGSLAFGSECHANPQVYPQNRCNHTTGDPVQAFAAAATQLRGVFE